MKKFFIMLIFLDLSLAFAAPVGKADTSKIFITKTCVTKPIMKPISKKPITIKKIHADTLMDLMMYDLKATRTPQQIQKATTLEKSAKD
jgi:hypothetical protein